MTSLGAASVSHLQVSSCSASVCYCAGFCLRHGVSTLDTRDPCLVPVRSASPTPTPKCEIGEYTSDTVTRYILSWLLHHHCGLAPSLLPAITYHLLGRCCRGLSRLTGRGPTQLNYRQTTSISVGAFSLFSLRFRFCNVTLAICSVL